MQVLVWGLFPYDLGLMLRGKQSHTTSSLSLPTKGAQSCLQAAQVTFSHLASPLQHFQAQSKGPDGLGITSLCNLLFLFFLFLLILLFLPTCQLLPLPTPPSQGLLSSTYFTLHPNTVFVQSLRSSRMKPGR